MLLYFDDLFNKPLSFGQSNFNYNSPLLSPWAIIVQILPGKSHWFIDPENLNILAL